MNNLSPEFAGTRANVDNPICSLNGLFIVLDDDERVTQVSQFQQGIDEPAIVSLVETNTGFIQDIEDAGKARTNLSGESNALSLTTGQRPCAARHTEIVQSHFEQELQTGSNLAQNGSGDGFISLRKGQRVHELVCF